MTVVRNEKIGRAPSCIIFFIFIILEKKNKNKNSISLSQAQLITEFDLDAPIRQGRSLTDEDNV